MNLDPACDGPAEETDWALPFRGRQLARPRTGGPEAPWFTCAEAARAGLPRPPEALALGHWRGRRLWTWEAAEGSASGSLPDSFDRAGDEGPWGDLRSHLGSLSDEAFVVAGQASQMRLWQLHNRFCGQCGGPTRRIPGEWSYECPACALRRYPRLSPAVIVLVTRDGALLLGHNHKAPANHFSLIAGFVEPGESLEEAVCREVREETGLRVRAPVYRYSQNWPFPDALMFGFTAEAEPGPECPDGVEITELGWFKPDALPSIPRPGSIARRLIDDWRAGAFAAPRSF